MSAKRRKSYDDRKNMTAKPSLTVVLPAHNEESSLKATCENLLSSLTRECDAYEILIIDDGSTDGTGSVMEHLASSNPAIRAFRNESNRGIGYSIRRGMMLASMEHVMYWSAGTDMTEGMLHDMLIHTGEYEMVVPYIANPEFRGPGRRLLSRGYTALLNALFGLRLRYYNGTTIFPVRRVQQFLREHECVCDDYTAMAELLIRMIRFGIAYKEIPTRHRPLTPVQDQRSVFRKILATARSVTRLYWLASGGA